ncbi:hypothetical protein [Streptomyces sp. NPDC127033]|uniref:hypothetical protein n=1 Tax=Streptomyces sp. NPDC127033 TaxID=3347110 RepID=UPI0036500251
MVETKAIRGGGVSLATALRAPWRAMRKRADGVAIPGHEGSGTGVGVILFLSVVEIVVVDVLLSATWARVVALVLGLASSYVLLGFVAALGAYPHRLSGGTLTVAYGATFHAEVPLTLIGEVAERRAILDQRRTAEISDDVLSIPVMSTTNVVLKLHEPVRVEAGKAVGTVREIRLHATDSGSAVRSVREAMAGAAAGEPAPAAAPTAVRTPEAGPAVVRVPGWLRRLRWAGLIVLAVEVLLVTTGLLDWRIAAGILVVTEGTLALLGLVFGAAFVSQYRRLRRADHGRRAAFGEAFFSLMPPPVAEMVRHELGAWSILALAVTFRTRIGPGDKRLGKGVLGRPTGVVALLLAAGGVSLLTGGEISALKIVGAVVLLYAAAVTGAFAAAGRVRPHVLGATDIELRWGLHHSVRVPLTSVRRMETADGAPPSTTEFVVPGRARQTLTLHLAAPVEVPTRTGARRPVTTVSVRFSDAAAVRDTIAEHTVEEAR